MDSLSQGRAVVKGFGLPPIRSGTESLGRRTWPWSAQTEASTSRTSTVRTVTPSGAAEWNPFAWL